MAGEQLLNICDMLLYGTNSGETGLLSPEKRLVQTTGEEKYSGAGLALPDPADLQSRASRW